MTDSLIAVNAADLSLVGLWQIPKSQTIVDSDFGSSPTLFEATINNVLHHMVGLIDKNGIYYAFDRSNISAGPIWQERLADPRLSHGVSIDISSSVWDGTNLYEAAGTTTINGQTCTGSLRALNPATGQFIWEACLPVDPLGPTIGVPELVVVGVGVSLMIFDTTTGKQLFTYQDSAHSTTSNFLGPASISNGILYAGNMDHYLYAFGL
jgi:outer membrane protein assembly factor BamB